MRKSQTLTAFRLTNELQGILEDRAMREKQQPNLLAHDLVSEALRQNGKPDAVLAKMESLEKQIHQLREELVLVTEVLLAAAGKVSPSEASQWVDANLKPK